MTNSTNNSFGPDEVDAFGWTIQRGYVYRVVYGPDAPRCVDAHDGGGTIDLGFHGNDAPPCGAEYLYGDENETLVISSHDDPAGIPAVDGVTLEPVRLEPGDHRHDGTWEFRVLEVNSDGETVIAGRC